MNIDHELDQLPHHTPEILWNQVRYESGRYGCSVERNGNHGTLTVVLLGLFHDHVLHEEPVKIDRLDIDAWRIRSVAVICKPESPVEGCVTLHPDARCGLHGLPTAATGRCTACDAEVARVGGEVVGDREDVSLDARPPMEIGNVWVHDNRPNQIHYMLHYTVDGQPEQRHLVELDGSALAKILRTRVR